MSLSDLIPSPVRLVLELLFVSALVGGAWYGYHLVHESGRAQGVAETTALWDKEKLAQDAATTQAFIDERAKSDTLQAEKVKLRKEKDAQINAIGLELNDALKRLHDRPSRPPDGGETDLPSDSATGPALGGTGAGLYREDGEFLAREASRAKRLRAHLIECQAAYAKAAEAVK